MTDTSIYRFYRRIAFGLAPGQAAPADPVRAAQAQLSATPPLALIERDGTTRKDLPDWVVLRSGVDQVMLAYSEQIRIVQETREQGKNLSPEQFQGLVRERIALPLRNVEAWKEVQARACGAVYGVRPVFERFWHFWANHFMVAPGGQQINALIGPYQRGLRPLMQGSFRDMLWYGVTDPAMLIYLDNNRSTGPNSRVARAGRVRQSINENLGRELLELFSVSPASGYTQADVEQATLILTGWRENAPGRAYRRAAPLGTYFDNDRHEPGSQTVLGKQYSGAFRPASKLENLITDLAAHPATAKYLARKLCVYFIDDDPPESAVKAVEKVFLDSNGALPEVHKEVIAQAWKTLETTRKLSSPETWFLQMVNASGADLPRDCRYLSDARRGRVWDVQRVLMDLGQPLPNCPQPNGWPIRSAEWLSKEMLDRRIRLASLWSGEMQQKGLLSVAVLEAALERTAAPDSTSRRLISEALKAGRLAQAQALLMVAPEFLWS